MGSLRRLQYCLLILGFALPGLVWSEPSPGVLAARVWGLAKYHHPQLVRCTVDWDRELLQRWAVLEAAAAPSERDAAIAALLDAAGQSPGQSPDAQTPAWIAEAPLDDALRRRLAWLAAQQPQQQCKVAMAFSLGPASFDADQGHATSTPDRAHRALAALRYWNAIEYFFPYKDVIGRDWAAVLEEHLPQVLDASPGLPFVHAMRRFSAEINDTHAGLAHPFSAQQYGAGFAPFAVRPVEGRSLVVRVADIALGQVAIGDELLAVDGEPVATRLPRVDQLGYGSNPAVRWVAAHRNVTTGESAQGQFRLRRPDGSEYTLSLPRAMGHAAVFTPPPVWRVEALPQCRIGVIDMARLREQDVGTALQALHDTDALLFDIRGYPQGTMWPLVDRLYPAPTAVAQFSYPRLDRPGRFDRIQEVLGGTRPSGYRGRFLLLQDDQTLSQAEYTLMGLQAEGRAITFGSQTAAADGNITHVYTPGDLRLTLTGLGVFYPDGRATQRIGIVPDVHVTPTRQGLIEGRDEVMRAALDCRWVEAQTPKRLPVQGMFYAVERSGEGIDVQRDRGGTIAVFSYHYDEQGRPEWLLSAQADHNDPEQTGFMEFRRRQGQQSHQVREGYGLDYHRGPYAPVCAIADQSALHPRARWRWPVNGGEHESCVRPILTGALGPATGTWAGTGEESGWGLSLHQSGGLIVAVVYAYDAAGHPRWLLGQAQWSGQGSLRIDLQRAQGFCQACPAVPIQMSEAGWVALEFGDFEQREGHRLSIDADFGDGTRWQREAMPLVRVSRPLAQ